MWGTVRGLPQWSGQQTTAMDQGSDMGKKDGTETCLGNTTKLKNEAIFPTEREGRGGSEVTHRSGLSGLWPAYTPTAAGPRVSCTRVFTESSHSIALKRRLD